MLPALGQLDRMNCETPAYLYSMIAPATSEGDPTRAMAGAPCDCTVPVQSVGLSHSGSASR
jgi:hypothetical protein